MKFKRFETEALRMWEEIPPEFKEGIDGLVISRELQSHPDHDDYYTMGMCYTEPYPSDYAGPDTTRSFLALYYGSFLQVAKGDPDFPWEEELWETITHELRHHLEYLAEDDDLEGVDYALEETYRRDQGLDFDPWYWQSGLELAPDVFRVERDVYVEWEWGPEVPDPGSPVEVEWDGRVWSVPFPDDPEDIHYVWLEGLDSGGGGWVQVVLVRRIGWWERLKRMVSREQATIGESEVRPRAVGEAPDASGPDDGRPGGGAGGPPPREDEEGYDA